MNARASWSWFVVVVLVGCGGGPAGTPGGGSAGGGSMTSGGGGTAGGGTMGGGSAGGGSAGGGAVGGGSAGGGSAGGGSVGGGTAGGGSVGGGSAGGGGSVGGGSAGGGAAGGGSAGGGATGGGSAGGGSMPPSIWTKIPVNTTQPLNAIAVAESKLYLVGGGGLCFETTATSLVPCNIPGVGTTNLLAVAAGQGQDVVVTGEGGAIHKRAAIAGQPLVWRQVTVTGAGAVRAAYTDGVDGFAFGDSGLAARFPLVSTVNNPTPFTGATVTLQGATGFTAGFDETVWAVGASGTVVQWNGSGAALTPETSGTTRLTTGELVAVGAGGVIRTRSAAGTWSAQTSGTTQELLGVFEGYQAVFAVGTNGTIVFRTLSGTQWNPSPSGVTVTLRGGARRIVNGTTTSFIVGDMGTLLAY